MTEITEGDVLDLPEERQRELAAMFKLSLEDWRARMIEIGKRAEAALAEARANEVAWDDLTPEEQESVLNMQGKIDSANGGIRRIA